MCTSQVQICRCLCSRQLSPLYWLPIILDCKLRQSKPKRHSLVTTGAQKRGWLSIADPLGLPIHYYKHIFDRLSFADFGVRELIKEPLQKLSSYLCGFYCIYIAHFQWLLSYYTIDKWGAISFYTSFYHMILEYQSMIYNAGTLNSLKFAYSFQRKQKTVDFI